MMSIDSSGFFNLQSEPELADAVNDPQRFRDIFQLLERRRRTEEEEKRKELVCFHI